MFIGDAAPVEVAFVEVCIVVDCKRLFVGEVNRVVDVGFVVTLVFTAKVSLVVDELVNGVVEAVFEDVAVVVRVLTDVFIDDDAGAAEEDESADG